MSNYPSCQDNCVVCETQLHQEEFASRGRCMDDTAETNDGLFMHGICYSGIEATVNASLNNAVDSGYDVMTADPIEQAMDLCALVKELEEFEPSTVVEFVEAWRKESVR